MDAETVANGLRADGLSTVLGGVFNAFPYTAFAQNVGLVRMTGIKSRFVVAIAGVILVLLGFFPSSPRWSPHSAAGAGRRGAGAVRLPWPRPASRR